MKDIWLIQSLYEIIDVTLIIFLNEYLLLKKNVKILIKKGYQDQFITYLICFHLLNCTLLIIMNFAFELLIKIWSH